nr:hypothetical protein [Corynebacterium accolens]
MGPYCFPSARQQGPDTVSHARTSWRLSGRTGYIATATAALIGLASPLVAPAQAFAPDLSSLAQQHLPASPLDELGRPTPETQDRVRAFAAQPWIPEEARNAILSGLAFFAGNGDGDGGVALPQGDNPHFRQFYWPTVSAHCIGGTNAATGSAIAVPGPTEIPAPGAGEGETAFLFTALGTPPAAPDQGGMHVQWFNINTLQSGITPLHNNGINQDGPTTLSGTAHTGKGLVIALLSGSVNTTEARCDFAPTAAFLEVK